MTGFETFLALRVFRDTDAAFHRRHDKGRGLVTIHLFANDTCLPGLLECATGRAVPHIKHTVQALPETLVERRHFLRQVVQRAAVAKHFGWFAFRQGFDRGNKPVKGVTGVPQRLQPQCLHGRKQHFIDDSVAKLKFIGEMVVQSAFGQTGCRQYLVQAHTLETVPVHLQKCRLEDPGPRLIWIAFRPDGAIRVLHITPAC